MSNHMSDSDKMIGKFSSPLFKHHDTRMVSRSIEDGSFLCIYEGIKALSPKMCLPSLPCREPCSDDVTAYLSTATLTTKSISLSTVTEANKSSVSKPLKLSLTGHQSRLSPVTLMIVFLSVVPPVMALIR